MLVIGVLAGQGVFLFLPELLVPGPGHGLEGAGHRVQGGYHPEQIDFGSVPPGKIPVPHRRGSEGDHRDPVFVHSLAD